MSELAEDRPLLCLLDDAHLIDQASAAALLFAVRRMHDDPVGVVLAARDGDRPFPAEGIESLTVPRLDRAGAVDLLGTVRSARPDRRRSDPAGLPRQSPRRARTRRRTGGGIPTGRIAPRCRRYRRSVGSSSTSAPSWSGCRSRPGGPGGGCCSPPIGAAAVHRGRGPPRRHPHRSRTGRGGATRRVAAAVVFRHPLVRAAAYQGLPIARRLATHRAWADTLTDTCTGVGTGDADHRAWHLAAATAASTTSRPPISTPPPSARSIAVHPLPRPAPGHGQRCSAPSRPSGPAAWSTPRASRTTPASSTARIESR